MKPPAFDYVAPETVEEAIDLLAEHGEEAKVLAGGQSLVPMLNFRLVNPSVLIDIRKSASSGGIEPNGDCIRIGALTRHRALETSAVIQARFPVLAEAMTHVAHLAIRNRGTIGGSLCHADPAAELPALAVLLDARISVARQGGKRIVDAQDFFEGALSPAVEGHELVTHVDFPLLPSGAGWGFHEFARRSGDFGIAGAAVTVAQSGGLATDVRVALLGVSDTPVRMAAAERLLAGTSFAPDAIAAAIDGIRCAIEPDNDLHASADYRRHLAGVLAGRALRDAWARAGGGVS